MNIASILQSSKIILSINLDLLFNKTKACDRRGKNCWMLKAEYLKTVNNFINFIYCQKF